MKNTHQISNYACVFAKIKFLLQKIKKNNKSLLIWLGDNNLLSKEMKCPLCREALTIVDMPIEPSSDLEAFSCFKNKFRLSCSIDQNLFFAGSKMSLKKIILFIYFW